MSTGRATPGAEPMGGTLAKPDYDVLNVLALKKMAERAARSRR